MATTAAGCFRTSVLAPPLLWASANTVSLLFLPAGPWDPIESRTRCVSELNVVAAGEGCEAFLKCSAGSWEVF